LNVQCVALLHVISDIPYVMDTSVENPPKSLGDIAKALGVSRSTVSRALRDDARISLSTRERVQTFAREHAYQPDPLVAHLAAHAWRKRREQGSKVNIAYLTLAEPGTDPSTNLRFKGAASIAKGLGYGVELLNLTGYSDPSQLGRIAYARGVRGLICGFRASSWLMEASDFPWKRFAVVAAGVNLRQLPVHTVSLNGVASVELALGKLRERGFRRIGLATVSFGELSEMDLQKTGTFLVRQTGWSDAERVPIWTGGRRKVASLREWVLRERPDVVLGNLGLVHQMLAETGIAMPDEVAFAGLFLHEEEKRGPGIISGGERVGRAAMNLLDTLLQRNETGLPIEPMRIMVQPTWRDRNC